MKIAKKVLSVLGILTISAAMLSACTMEGVTIEKTYVNDEMHLIVEYSDGNTKDLGYVGVELPSVSVKDSYVDKDLHLIVEYSDGSKKDLGYVGVDVTTTKEVYTVTFVDKDGKVLLEQKVYEGLSAYAPQAPAVENMEFTGWDKDITNVTGNMTVKAVYGKGAQFTVTFVDEQGNVLKKEEVFSGKGATAPIAPGREDTVFERWDTSFDKVTADITVKAIYRAKNTYAVTFTDYSGVVLGTASVKEGGTAVAPVTPTRDGYTFTGWSSSIAGVTSNMTVSAQYTMNSGENILDISYRVSGNSVTVTFAVKGTVKFCGLEGEVSVPSGLTYQSITEGDGATANYKDGKIYFMFSSNNGKNVTSATTIMTVTFQASETATSESLATVVKDIYDQDYNSVSGNVIGQTIKVK